MMVCGWTPLTSQHGPENDHKRQCSSFFSKKGFSILENMLQS